MNNFSIVFLSIILEAVPFILIGIFISSLIQVFISEETMQRLIPRKYKFISLLMAACTGLIFPICECGIVPIARRLIKKGVPSHLAVTFMLAAPIINPVVIASTAYAFPGMSEFPILRVLLGFFVAISVGYAIKEMYEGVNILKDTTDSVACGCDSSHHCHHKIEGHDSQRTAPSIQGYFFKIIEHMTEEFFEVGKYLIIGAGLAAAIQTIISRELILSIGQGTITSIIAMMAFAFLISLCSEADAFVASTFLGSFSTVSILAFLVMGPMLDVKNLLIISAGFKRDFTYKLLKLIVTLIFIECFFMSLFL